MCCYSNKTEMFRFETANFLIRATIEPDSDLDLSWDKTGEVREKLSDGEYEAFGTVVTVEHDGLVLGESSLWGSIYADPAEFFKEHVGLAAKSRADGRSYGCYFPGMISEAIGEARKTLATMPKVKTA